GICFAVPSNTAQRVVSLLIRDGRVIRSYLGITGESWPIHRRVSRYYHLEQESGVRVAHLDPNGPAQHAGLKKEDVLISLASQPASTRSPRPAKTALNDRIVGGLVRVSATIDA